MRLSIPRKTARGETAPRAAEPAAGFRCPGCRRHVGALLSVPRRPAAAAPSAWLCQGCAHQTRARAAEACEPRARHAMMGARQEAVAR